MSAVTDRMAADSDRRFLAVHGAEGARVLLAAQGLAVSPDVSIEPSSALRYLAARRIEKAENVTFLEALRRLETE